MTKEELAGLINGRQYRDEITKEEEWIAKESGLIVIFGCSDDLLEFVGALDDEIGAYDGTDFFIATDGMEIMVDEEEETYKKAKGLEAYAIDRESRIDVNRFSAEWCPEGTDMSWEIKTELPHAKFEIMEDGEVYGIGIVISVSDLKTI